MFVWVGRLKFILVFIFLGRVGIFFRMWFFLGLDEGKVNSDEIGFVFGICRVIVGSRVVGLIVKFV